MDYYDHISPGYIELHGREQLRKVRIIEEHLSPKKDDIALDIGCGPCMLSFDCKLYGIDSSFGLLKQAKIPKVLGNAEHLPFKDNSFDIVTSISALQNFQDIELALREADRVGRRDFAFTFFRRSGKAHEIEKWISRIFQVKEKVKEEMDDIIFCSKKNAVNAIPLLIAKYK